jgi:hypothetical protein
MMVCARFAARAVAVAGFLVGVSGATALGSISYSYGTNQVTTNYNPGDPVTLDVYLVETLSGSSSLITADGNLDGAAFKVVRTSGTATISSVAFGAGFDAGAPFNTSSVTTTTATLNESTGFGSPGVGLSGDHVKLGTITFSAPNVAGITSTFDLQRFNTVGGNTITRASHDLDKDSSSPAYTGATGLTQITIITVPEPMSFGLLAIGLPFLAMRRRARSA